MQLQTRLRIVVIEQAYRQKRSDGRIDGGVKLERSRLQDGMNLLDLLYCQPMYTSPFAMW